MMMEWSLAVKVAVVVKHCRRCLKEKRKFAVIVTKLHGRRTH
jgi:hypothetical protein